MGWKHRRQHHTIDEKRHRRHLAPFHLPHRHVRALQRHLFCGHRNMSRCQHQLRHVDRHCHQLHLIHQLQMHQLSPYRRECLPLRSNCCDRYQMNFHRRSRQSHLDHRRRRRRRRHRSCRNCYCRMCRFRRHSSRHQIQRRRQTHGHPAQPACSARKTNQRNGLQLP